MMAIYNFLVENIYLYICIILVLVIIATILLIIVSNQKNRKKIKSELIEAEKVDDELQQLETKNNDLEDILKKMQEDMDVKPEDVVKKFEEEQEEKAIISYKELVDNVNSGKIDVVEDEISDVNFVDTLTNSIENEDNIVQYTSIEENLENNNEEKVTPEMVKDAIMNISASSVKEEPKKFKQSAFISPIYGVMDEKLEYPTVKKINNDTTLDLLNTKDYNELSLAIERQEEFLQALKEFRNNL